MMNLRSNEKKLIKACKQSNLKLLQDLVNSQKKTTTTSSMYHKNTESKSLDMNCREPKFQMTPLMIATLKGSKDVVLFLIKNGANIALRDIKGNTAIQLACMKQRFTIIDILLQNGANPNDVNISGWSCLINAVNYFHEDSSNMLLLLLQSGAQVEHKDNNGFTCVDHAIRKNKTKILRVLLNFNPVVAQQSIRGLISATVKGQLKIIMLLLNYGIDPNQIELVNGTGPLHEAVRYNEIHDEMGRVERLKIVKILASFGANPDLVNLRNETPIKLAQSKPKYLAQKYMDAMRVYYTEEPRQPKYVKKNNNLLVAQIPAYPLLKPSFNWTKNDPKFCSYFVGNDLVTNLIDGNPYTLWTSPGQNLNWVIFDLKACHVITKIRIYCWRSKEMPYECYLQVSNCIDGPWNCVHKFKCEMLGSSLRKNPGVPQDFDGFFAISRFWRLVIAKNHGAQQTSFHGIEFFGYDYRISKLIEELRLSEYEDVLIENDLNQIESLVNCTFDQFEKLPVYDKDDKEKLWSFITEFQKKAQSVKKLEWFNEPVAYEIKDRILPPFSIVSSTYLIDSLQLICYGGGIMNGDTCVEMEPGGINDPSMAIFRNISFSNTGKFLIEVRSLNYPHISLSSQPIQIFDPNDPEYLNLVNSLSKMNETAFESEEETFNQSYCFPDFKFDQSTRIIFNKWSDVNCCPRSIESTPHADLMRQQYLTVSSENFYLKEPQYSANCGQPPTSLPIINMYNAHSTASSTPVPSIVEHHVIEFDEQEFIVEFSPEMTNDDSDELNRSFTSLNHVHIAKVSSHSVYNMNNSRVEINYNFNYVNTMPVYEQYEGEQAVVPQSRIPHVSEEPKVTDNIRNVYEEQKHPQVDVPTKRDSIVEYSHGIKPTTDNATVIEEPVNEQHIEQPGLSEIIEEDHEDIARTDSIKSFPEPPPEILPDIDILRGAPRVEDQSEPISKIRESLISIDSLLPDIDILKNFPKDKIIRPADDLPPENTNFLPDIDIDKKTQEASKPVEPKKEEQKRASGLNKFFPFLFRSKFDVMEKPNKQSTKPQVEQPHVQQKQRISDASKVHNRFQSMLHITELPDIDIDKNENVANGVMKSFMSLSNIQPTTNDDSALPDIDIWSSEIRASTGPEEEALVEKSQPKKDSLPDIDIDKEKAYIHRESKQYKSLIQLSELPDIDIYKPEFRSSLELNQSDESRILPETISIPFQNDAISDPKYYSLPEIDILTAQEKARNSLTVIQVEGSSHLPVPAKNDFLPDIDIHKGDSRPIQPVDNIIEKQQGREYLPDIDILQNEPIPTMPIESGPKKHSEPYLPDIDIGASRPIMKVEGSVLPDIDILRHVKEEDNVIRLIEDATTEKSIAPQTTTSPQKSGLLKFQRKSTKNQKASSTSLLKCIKEKLSSKGGNKKTKVSSSTSVYHPTTEMTNSMNELNSLPRGSGENFTIRAKNALNTYKEQRKKI